MRQIFYRNKKVFFLFAGLLFATGFIYFFIYDGFFYPEAEELSSKPRSFKELSIFFTALAERKGAVYAFEALRRVTVEPDIDMHLLAHVVGDLLYRQKGMQGISLCTHDFRNACSHSIVVGAFMEEGEAAIPNIRRACYAAPGGKGAYTMCFHGLGHGVLAYTDYAFPKAVELCQKTGTEAYRNREYAECVGGAVMELIGGGFHDQELWKNMRPQYLTPDDPLSLCSKDMIPDNEAREVCYVYLTPYLFEIVASNKARPTNEDIGKAFLYCGAIPFKEAVFRDACFRGFGKEFVGLVLDRDIRQVSFEDITDDQLMHVYDLCLLAENREGSVACMLHALDSLFWGGENDPRAAIQFCIMMPEEFYQRSCMQHLLKTAKYYFENTSKKQDFCEQVPWGYKNRCMSD